METGADSFPTEIFSHRQLSNTDALGSVVQQRNMRVLLMIGMIDRESKRSTVGRLPGKKLLTIEL